MKLSPTTYVYPPRTSNTTPFESAKFYQKFGYKAQYKFNDSNIIVHFNDGVITLWTRHKSLLKNYPLPAHLDAQLRDLVVRLGLDPKGHHRFNGGLLHFKHSAIKNTIVLWDILMADGEYLVGTPYQKRYDKLFFATNGEYYSYLTKEGEEITVGHKFSPNVFLPIIVDDWDKGWANLEAINKQYDQPLLEGLVMKSGKHKLEFGYTERNNEGLMVKSRVETKRHLC